MKITKNRQGDFEVQGVLVASFMGKTTVLGKPMKFDEQGETLKKKVLSYLQANPLAVNVFVKEGQDRTSTKFYDFLNEVEIFDDAAARQYLADETRGLVRTLDLLQGGGAGYSTMSAVAEMQFDRLHKLGNSPQRLRGPDDTVLQDAKDFAKEHPVLAATVAVLAVATAGGAVYAATRGTRSTGIRGEVELIEPGVEPDMHAMPVH